MSSSEQGPTGGGERDHYDERSEQYPALQISIATFTDAIGAIANGQSAKRLQAIIEQGVFNLQTAIIDSGLSVQQQTRAVIAMTAAGKMAGVETPFQGMIWVREPFNKVTQRLRNNGSPVLIQPTGPARRSNFSVIAIPGLTNVDNWTLYRREKRDSRRGYVMVQLHPRTSDLVHLGSDDIGSDIYGFTTLTGRNTSDAYAAYIDKYHVTVELTADDLVLQDHSFLGTSITFVMQDPMQA